MRDRWTLLEDEPELLKNGDFPVHTLLLDVEITNLVDFQCEFKLPSSSDNHLTGDIQVFLWLCKQKMWHTCGAFTVQPSFLLFLLFGCLQCCLLTANATLAFTIPISQKAAIRKWAANKQVSTFLLCAVSLPILILEVFIKSQKNTNHYGHK